MKFVKEQSGIPVGRSKGSFNFAGLLARKMPMATQCTPARFCCYFPVPPCYFRPISRLRVDFIADLHFARPHLQGFTGTSHWRPEEIFGAAIKAAKDGDVGAMRLCWDRFAPVPRSARDLPELTVIHINFIRIMISALDRGQLVLPKGSNVAKEIDEYVRIVCGQALEKGIDSAPTAGKARIAAS